MYQQSCTALLIKVLQRSVYSRRFRIHWKFSGGSEVNPPLCGGKGELPWHLKFHFYRLRAADAGTRPWIAFSSSRYTAKYVCKLSRFVGVLFLALKKCIITEFTQYWNIDGKPILYILYLVTFKFPLTVHNIVSQIGPIGRFMPHIWDLGHS